MQRHILCAIGALLFATQALAAPPPVEAYGRLPEMERVAMSPDGSLYAVVRAVGAGRRVIVADAAGFVVETVDTGPEKVIKLEWAGNGHLLIFIGITRELPDFAIMKKELVGCYTLDLKTKTLKLVFDNTKQSRVATAIAGYFGSALIADRRYLFFGGYSYERDHGKRVALGALKRDRHGALYPDLYKVDPATGEFELAAKGEPTLVAWLVNPAGEVAARKYYNNETGAWRITRDRPGEPLLAGWSATGDVEIEGFGRSGDSVLIRTDESGLDVVREISLSSGQVGAATDLDISGPPLIDPLTRRWIGNWTPGLPRTAKLFSANLEARVAGAYKAFPGHVVSLAAYSADFKHMMMFTEGGDDSGAYWLVDIDGHSADPIWSTVSGGRFERAPWLGSTTLPLMGWLCAAC